MNVKYILLGLLFFINPNVEIIDIFPDFIGACFILKGISHLSQIDEKCGFARKAMLTLTYLNAAKTLLIFVFMVISEKEMTWMLVFTSCFGMLELGLLVYFFAMLDKSLNYTAMYYDAPAVYNNSTSFTSLSIAFVIVKVVMSILPEIISLFDIDYGYVGNFDINWDFISGMLIALNLIVVTLTGIVWYINSRNYWKKVAKEKEYLAAIEEKYYKEVGSNRALLTYKAFKTMSTLIVAAVLFLICIRLDGIDFLPDFASAILFLAAGLRIKSLYKKYTKKIIVFSSIFFALALAEWSLWFLFCNHYYSTSDATVSFISSLEIYRAVDPNVDNYYLLLCLLDAFKTVSAVLCVFSFIPCIREIIAEHTGAIAEIRTEATQKKTLRIQKSLYILTNIFALFSVISISFDVISTLLCFDVYFLIIMAAGIGIAFSVYTWLYCGKLAEAIENKYMY